MAKKDVRLSLHRRLNGNKSEPLFMVVNNAKKKRETKTNLTKPKLGKQLNTKHMKLKHGILEPGARSLMYR